jgi:hypothetical protein
MCRYLLSYLHLISYQVIYILYIKRRRVGSLHSRESTSLLCKQPRKQNRFEKRGKRREERGDAKFKQNSVNIYCGANISKSATRYWIIRYPLISAVITVTSMIIGSASPSSQSSSGGSPLARGMWAHPSVGVIVGSGNQLRLRWSDPF